MRSRAERDLGVLGDRELGRCPRCGGPVGFRQNFIRVQDVALHVQCPSRPETDDNAAWFGILGVARRQVRSE